MVDLSKNTETDREITAFFWNYQIFSEKKRIFVWIIVFSSANAGLLNFFSGV